jgi:multidrug efflux pump subunit AcrA (membrane-fusion protein)
MSLRGRRTWWIAAGAVVVVAAVIVALVLSRDGKHVTAAPSTSKVTRGSVTSTVSAAGTVQSQQSRTLSFSQNGTLTEVDVKPGDTVNPGQVLARIDATTAQSAVDSAQQAVDSAQDAVDNAQNELNAAKATPTACPTAKASPTVKAAPSTAASGGAGRAGGSGGAPAPTQPARTPAAPAQPPAQTCSTSGAQNRGTSSGTDALLTAQQRLNNAELTLTQAETKRDGCTITAPIAGKVLSVAAGVGASAGSNFITVAGTTDIVVNAQFTEAEIAHLALNQKAKITLPDQVGTAFTGTVTQIDPAGTISTRLVRYGALISFDKAPDTVLYGQSANVVVTTQSVDNVLFVPSTAISERKTTGTGDKAETTGTVEVRTGPKIERRTVRLGLRGDVNTEVKSGLAEGDVVLTSAAT